MGLGLWCETKMYWLGSATRSIKNRLKIWPKGRGRGAKKGNLSEVDWLILLLWIRVPVEKWLFYLSPLFLFPAEKTIRWVWKKLVLLLLRCHCFDLYGMEREDLYRKVRLHDLWLWIRVTFVLISPYMEILQRQRAVKQDFHPVRNWYKVSR